MRPGRCSRPVLVATFPRQRRLWRRTGVWLTRSSGTGFPSNGRVRGESGARPTVAGSGCRPRPIGLYVRFLGQVASLRPRAWVSDDRVAAPAGNAKEVQVRPRFRRSERPVKVLPLILWSRNRWGSFSCASRHVAIRTKIKLIGRRHELLRPTKACRAGALSCRFMTTVMTLSFAIAT
jgi:hypothetical protein